MAKIQLSAIALVIICMLNLQLTEAGIGNHCTIEGNECQIANINFYCNYQTETCQKKHSGCDITSEQKACLHQGPILRKTAGNCKGKGCPKIIKFLAMMGQKSCDRAQEFICDLNQCPENYGKSFCKIVSKNLNLIDEEDKNDWLDDSDDSSSNEGDSSIFDFDSNFMFDEIFHADDSFWETVIGENNESSDDQNGINQVMVKHIKRINDIEKKLMKKKIEDSNINLIELSLLLLLAVTSIAILILGLIIYKKWSSRHQVPELKLNDSSSIIKKATYKQLPLSEDSNDIATDKEKLIGE